MTKRQAAWKPRLSIAKASAVLKPRLAIVPGNMPSSKLPGEPISADVFNLGARLYQKAPEPMTQHALARDASGRAGEDDPLGLFREADEPVHGAYNELNIYDAIDNEVDMETVVMLANMTKRHPHGLSFWELYDQVFRDEFLPNATHSVPQAAGIYVMQSLKMLEF